MHQHPVQPFSSFEAASSGQDAAAQFAVTAQFAAAATAQLSLGEVQEQPPAAPSIDAHVCQVSLAGASVACQLLRQRVR